MRQVLTIASNFRIAEKHLGSGHVEHGIWYIGYKKILISIGKIVNYGLGLSYHIPKPFLSS